MSMFFEGTNSKYFELEIHRESDRFVFGRRSRLEDSMVFDVDSLVQKVLSLKMYVDEWINMLTAYTLCVLLLRLSEICNVM